MKPPLFCRHCEDKMPVRVEWCAKQAYCPYLLWPPGRQNHHHHVIPLSLMDQYDAFKISSGTLKL